MKYKATVNGNMAIIEANSSEEAYQIAVCDLIDIKIEEATEQDIEWYNAMSGRKG
jgi:hypothetical protein